MVLARIGIYGDIHLNSKNYGAHKDYPRESLEYFRKITEVTRDKQLTHLIGTGDFSFGRFHSLEYRVEVENNLAEQNRLTNGNRYELKGNHDIAGYGMTERDYYVSKGMLKPSANINIGNVYLNMIDYGKHEEVTPVIVDNEQYINVIIAHDFFKFSNSRVANFGKAIELDRFEKWFGADLLVCGHVHKIMNFSGYIEKNGLAHELKVYYPGCMTRPSYREGYTDEVGQMLILTVHDNGAMDFDIEQIPLWSLSDSFNLEIKAEKKKKREEKEARVDISDVVKQLDAHDRNVGNPEDIIASMDNIPEEYKGKAIELLKRAMA